jgi:Beta-galactosidase/beta-glucuronidase
MKKLLLIFLLIAAWSVQAREVYPLCDDWLFSFRYENSSDYARCVTLPHTWNLDALAGTIPYLRTTADYQRKLYVPQTWTGKRLFLKFYGVESVAHLFVYGTYVGEHRGGTTAYVFEITDRVKYGSENLLRVAVSNAFTGDVLPLSSIPQHLRRHQPGGRPHRHRSYRRFASLSGARRES